jgi:hypothetical protein
MLIVSYITMLCNNHQKIRRPSDMPATIENIAFQCCVPSSGLQIPHEISDPHRLVNCVFISFLIVWFSFIVIKFLEMD